MTTRWREVARRTWAMAALSVSLGFVVGYVLGARASRLPPVDLSYSPNWITILDEDAVLDPAEGTVHLRVGVISRLSGEGANQTVQENKIEVTQNGKAARFMWPDRGIYAAGRCEIADLDNNGKKELLLFDWNESLRGVRVVSYSHGQFRFRKSIDELLSLDKTLAPTDLGGDGHLEFVSEQAFPNGDDRNRVQVPRVMRWGSADGFQDVSAQFPSYYRERYLPVVQEKLSHEPDPQKRKVYEGVIAYIERTVGPHPLPR